MPEGLLPKTGKGGGMQLLRHLRSQNDPVEVTGSCMAPGTPENTCVALRECTLLPTYVPL